MDTNLDYNQYDGGEIIRVTQTNRNKQFCVFGDVYSHEILRGSTVLKTYYEQYPYRTI